MTKKGIVYLLTIIFALTLAVVLAMLRNSASDVTFVSTSADKQVSCGKCKRHTHRKPHTISDSKRVYVRKKTVSRVIRGRVREESGTPVVGVFVTLLLPDGRRMTKMTDKEGFYSFKLAVKGRVGITVQSDEHLAEMRYVWMDDSKESIDFSLRKEGKVVVEVVDKETERSIPNAEVFLMSRSAKVPIHTFNPFYTPGLFVCEGVKKGWYILRVESEGYVRHERLLKFNRKEMRLKVALVAEARITGMVVDETGKGIEGVKVVAGLTGRGTVTEIPDAVTSTDEEGKFTLKGLRAGETYIYAYKERYAPAATEDIRLSPGEWIDGMVLKLSRGAILKGRVVDENGASVSGAEVSLSALYFHSHHPLFLKKTETGLDGSFEFKFLADADYNITVKHKNYIPLQLHNFVSIRNEQDVEGIIITLKKGVLIAGRVSNSSGTPISGVRVVVSEKRERNLLREVTTTITDRNGSFFISNLEEGVYTIDFWSAGYAHKRLESIKAPSEGIEVVLRRRVSLRGSVLIDGVSASGVEVLLKRGNITIRRVTDEDGFFIFKGIEPGEYTLEVKKRKRLIERLSLNLESDREIIVQK